MTRVPPRSSGHIVTGPRPLDRQLQICLTLGLLGPMRTPHIKRVCGSDLALRTMQYHMLKLARAGLLWRCPLLDPLGKQPIKSAYLYGLTPAGAAWLQAYSGVPPERLVVKEGSVISSQRVIWSHMLDQVDFVSRLIAELRYDPDFLGIDVFPEYAKLKLIRIDALITLRFARRGIDAVPVPQRRPWWVPWLLSEESQYYPYNERYHIEVRMALEVDRSTEELAIIQRKGKDYCTVYLQGGWIPALRTFPIPVFLVRSERRLRSIHQAWRQGWWGQPAAPPGKRATMLAATFQRLQRSVIDGDWINDRGQTVTIFDQAHPQAPEIEAPYDIELAPEERERGLSAR